MIKKFRHIVVTDCSIIYCWVLGYWLKTPLASICLLTHSPIWSTGQYTHGSKRNTESLAKYPTINYTAIGYNNMSKFFYHQILADRFVLNLKKWKNSRCHFSYWYSIIGHQVIRLLPGTWSASNTEYYPWLKSCWKSGRIACREKLKWLTVSELVKN